MTTNPGARSAEATSLDGRTFTFETDRAVPFRAGDMVLLRAAGAAALGQVRRTTAGTHGGTSHGEGAVLMALDADGAPVRGEVPPFLDATIDGAPASLLAAFQHAAGATLPVGSWRGSTVDAVALLRAGGFNRHTFLCGQSGSGKTYALGVLLEQLLLATDLRLVVLDPNADFVRLGEVRPDAPGPASDRLGGGAVRVLRADGSGGEPLRMRFATMPARAQAALLQLDPVADRGEYSQFLRTVASLKDGSVPHLVAHLLDGSADERALGQRIENLGMQDWEVWARDLPSAAEVIREGPRATVLDLGGFHHPLEPLAVSLDVLEDLWARRAERVPTLVVIDEAHNLCSAEPGVAVQERVTERIAQIAAEGRKYGLWLLLSTQRPSKIHPQVLSQCDNLALMRMNSTADLDELAAVFGFVPPAMLQASPHFLQGEMLLAGAFVPVPTLARVGARLTFEGGSDVPVPLSGLTRHG
ncbi:ATP-binding protein [Cellulomonas sp. S1-8]|uniref:ATP-binding protein n=1 Tax=Cellulomonas sp. S1-8 TaxID=2904790 RepID=UPI002243A8B1|nr:ATP-binding protein [Cellulomonas sp. S1-8]UZN03672.1 ATP-binding protein [Cellulomonas sp. S1-8]